MIFVTFSRSVAHPMKWHVPVVFGLLAAGGFFAGQLFSNWSIAPELQAQGTRGPVNIPPPPPITAILPPVDTSAVRPVIYSDDGGRTASNGDFLAVTGSYGVGTSVLYLIDSKTRQLAVYEARGGSPDMRRIVFVGARKIDLDLQLEGYNDRSEYEYVRLRKLFEKGDTKNGEPTTGLEGRANGGK